MVFWTVNLNVSKKKRETTENMVLKTQQGPVMTGA